MNLLVAHSAIFISEIEIQFLVEKLLILVRFDTTVFYLYEAIILNNEAANWPLGRPRTLNYSVGFIDCPGVIVREVQEGLTWVLNFMGELLLFIDVEGAFMACW